MPLGLKEDVEFTPEQKKGLRELLLECLEHFDEQEMLDFLKHSIEFRVRYCPWPGDVLNPSPSPGPEPGPRTTPRSVTKRSIPNTSVKPTGASASSAANTVGPLTEAPTSIGVAAEGGQPTEANVEYVAADTPRLSEEDALSGISRRDEISPSVRDEPSKAQITGNDDKATKKLASHPEIQSRHRIVGKDTTANLAKRVSKKLGPHNSKPSLSDLASDNEQTESTVNETDTSKTEETESNDQSIVGSPEQVPPDVMAVNSDEGEFASVMKIDYNTMAHDSGTRRSRRS